MREVYYTPDAVAQGDLLAQVDNIRADRTPGTCSSSVGGLGLDLALPSSKRHCRKDVFFVDGNALAAA